MAITSDNVLYGWGSQGWLFGSGVIGDGTGENRATPVRIMENVVAVSAGQWHTMAIRTDGTLWGWGASMIGDGSVVQDRALSPVHIKDDVVAVSAGGQFTIAVTSDGTLWAWGAGGGRLGDGTSDYSLIPVRIMDNILLP